MLNTASVLERVAAGQLSADEAVRLISRPAPARNEALKGRWLRVQVSSLATGAVKVSVTLPLAWVDIGLKLGAIREPELAAVDWDEVLALVESGADGRLVEVEDLDRGERIEIGVE